MEYFTMKSVTPTTNPYAGGSLLVGYSRLLTQYNWKSSLPSVCNLRTHHTVVTDDLLNLVCNDTTHNALTLTDIT